MDKALPIAKIVGLPSQNQWSQVHFFWPETSDKQHQRGQLLAIITLVNPSGADEIAAIGKEAILRLHEEYYGNLSDSSLERLKIGIQVLAGELNGEDNFVLAAAARIGSVLFLAAYGQCQVLLLRQGELATILTRRSQN